MQDGFIQYCGSDGVERGWTGPSEKITHMRNAAT
jgi:hypothetical protein